MPLLFFMLSEYENQDKLHPEKQTFIFKLIRNNLNHFSV